MSGSRKREMMVRKIIYILVMMVIASAASAEELSVSEWQKLLDEFTAFNQEYSELVKNGEARPIKCGTSMLFELNSKRPQLALSSMGLFDRQDSMSYTYPTTHFVLHYTDNGDHAVYQYAKQDSLPGTPDYIFEAGKIMEEVYQHTIVDLGYTAPLPDSTAGGDSRMDVYFVNFPYYGVTIVDRQFNTNPPTGNAYMMLENDYKDFPGYSLDRLAPLSVTAAHEHFHTVQFAIDLSELESWQGSLSTSWVEMTGTFMEEEHYDDVNDYYGYLQFYYQSPQWSLRAGHQINEKLSLNMYGKVVFPIFLSEKFGTGIIKDIWDGCGTLAGPNWWLAADDAIRAISADSLNLGKVYREFTLWNLFTKNWARPGEYFSEAAAYDPIRFSKNVTSYPATVVVNDTLMPDNLGANYIALANLNSVPKGLVVSFNPDRNHPWGLQVVGLPSSPGSQAVVIDTLIYDSATTTIIIPNASIFSSIALIPSVLGGNGQRVSYSFTISELSDGLSQPNGGEELFAGIDYNITWFFADSVTTVDIDLTTDNEVSWTNIATVPNSPPLYAWTVPDTPSGQCKIRISDADNLSHSDQSNAVFSISTIGENSVGNPFPNPAWAGRHDLITFKALNASAEAQLMTVSILNLAGEKIMDLESEKSTGAVTVSWNFLNEAKEMVAAGPYMAVIKFAGETYLRKFMVLR